MKVYYDEDADLSALEGKTVAILGYGNQGRAQAQNMRDSHVNVIIGNIDDSYRRQAFEDGFKVYSISDAAKLGDIVCLELPDEIQKEIFDTNIVKHLQKGRTLLFASGYNFRFGFVVPPKDIDVIDLFPLTFGHYVRERYLHNQPLGAYMAIGQDSTGNAKRTALALAKAIGCTKGGVFETTFAHEIEINLFLEQVVYPAFDRIMVLSYETLVEAGYPPELVSLEMYLAKEPSEVFTVKADYGFFESSRYYSTTAQYGSMTRAPRIIKNDIKKVMIEHLREIQTGAFAKEWAMEQSRGKPVFNKLKDEGLAHPMNDVERRVKKWFRPSL